MNDWLIFLFGGAIGALAAYLSMGIYGLVLMKRSDDEG